MLRRLRWRVIDVNAEYFDEKVWTRADERQQKSEMMLSLISLDFETSLSDSFDSFRALVNSKRFEGKLRFIVFSFVDVFKELLSSRKGKETFSKIFAEYRGNYEFDEAFRFVENKFMKTIKNPKDLGKLIHFFKRPICTLETEDAREVVSWMSNLEYA